MCSFHAEVDAKARNDFISVIKRLCLRIKGAIARMHKASGSATADISDQIFPKPHNRPYDDEKDLFEKQKWFVSWYIDFLVREMQPTASYQRHITALKIMHYIVHIGLYMMNTVSFSYSRHQHHLTNDARISPSVVSSGGFY